MTRRLPILSLFAALVIAGSSGGQESPVPVASGDTAKPPKPGGIAARINDEIITWDEVDLKLKGGTEEEKALVRLPQLRKMAEDKLFLQEAKKHKLVIADALIDSELERQKKLYKSEEEFLRTITQVEGMSLSEYRDQIRNMLLVNALMQRLFIDGFQRPGPTTRLLLDFVSPEEVREYYRTHRDEFKAICEVDVIRLSLPFNGEAEKAAMVRLAESIRRRIDKGSNLFIMALYYMKEADIPKQQDGSRAPVMKSLKKEQSPFEPATNKILFEDLKQLEVSQVVVDKTTVNLFELRKRIDEKESSFEDAQAKIVKRLGHEKSAQNRKILRDELIKRSYVDPADLFNK